MDNITNSRFIGTAGYNIRTQFYWQTFKSKCWIWNNYVNIVSIRMLFFNKDWIRL